MATVPVLIYDGPNEGPREADMEVVEARWLNEAVDPYLTTCQRCGGECCNCGACRKTKGTGSLCFRCALVPMPRIPPREKVK